jgi:MYXO-CTERM domain-containing protein
VDQTACATIAAGGSCDLAVTFTPDGTTTRRTATLYLNSDLGLARISMGGAFGVQPLDADRDGVPNAKEQGPSGLDTGFDGNGDTVPDREQASVASLPSLDGQRYLTISTSVGTLEATAAVATPAGAPASHAFPFGFYGFRIVVPNPGDPAEVKVQLHGALPEGQPTWMMNGPAGWYDLATVTPVAYAGGALRFQLRDGGAGDHDGATNRQILDPGGPAWVKATPPPEAAGGGGGCGCGSPGEAGLWALALAWLAAAARTRAQVPRRRGG